MGVCWVSAMCLWEVGNSTNYALKRFRGKASESHDCTPEASIRPFLHQVSFVKRDTKHNKNQTERTRAAIILVSVLIGKNIRRLDCVGHGTSYFQSLKAKGKFLSGRSGYLPRQTANGSLPFNPRRLSCRRSTLSQGHAHYRGRYYSAKGEKEHFLASLSVF